MRVTSRVRSGAEDDDVFHAAHGRLQLSQLFRSIPLQIWDHLRSVSVRCAPFLKLACDFGFPALIRGPCRTSPSQEFRWNIPPICVEVCENWHPSFLRKCTSRRIHPDARAEAADESGTFADC